MKSLFELEKAGTMENYREQRSKRTEARETQPCPSLRVLVPLASSLVFAREQALPVDETIFFERIPLNEVNKRSPYAAFTQYCPCNDQWYADTVGRIRRGFIVRVREGWGMRTEQSKLKFQRKQEACSADLALRFAPPLVAGGAANTKHGAIA